MNAPLVDTHCHLDFESFGADFDDVLARAREVGIVKMVTIGSGREVASAQAALDVARKHAPFIVATIGIHPHDARVCDDAVYEELRALACDPLVVGIGETGLDYHYDHSPRDVQGEVFRRFIALGREVKKPIIVHTREAAAETLAILREEKASDIGGIMHCFSEDAAFAKNALDLGFVASFSGIVTFKNAAAIRDAAAKQPLDSILVETDAPFLAPIPYRGKRNEPSYIARTAACIADLRGMPDDAFRHATTQNAFRILGTGPLPPTS